MATLSPCPSSPSPSGLYPEYVRTAEGGSISLANVLLGTEKLRGGAIPIGGPLYLSPASPGTVVLRVGAGLVVQGSPLTLELTAAGLSPTAHAESHSPAGSDPIDIGTFGPFSPQVASPGQLGGIKPGRGVTVSPDGSLSVLIDSDSSALSASPGGVHLSLTSPLTISGSSLVISTPSGVIKGAVFLASPSGLIDNGSGGISIAGITAADGMAGSELVFQSPNGTSPKVLLNSGFIYTSVVSPGQLPVASSASPGISQVGTGLQITVSGVLSLASPIPKENLPLADGANLGAVFTSPGTAISLSSGLIDVELADTTITKEIAGIRVASDTFIRMAGTGVSPTASPDGWISGLLTFQDDLGTAAIITGNNRIQYGTPSPALAGAAAGSLLAKSEIETLISAASYGLTILYGKYHAGPPSVFPSSVTGGDRFLTAISPLDSPVGAWAGQGVTFADWTEISPENFAWVFTSPTEDQFFTDSTTGIVWFLDTSPSTSAVPYWQFPDSYATEANAGPVRPTVAGGLKIAGGDLTIRQGVEAGVRSGLTLTPGTGGNVLSVKMETLSSPSLEVNSNNELILTDGGIRPEHYRGRSVTLAAMNTDIAPSGTRDFIDVDTDGITVKLRGDTDDFRVTGVPVSSATTPLIHTDDGIGLAQESLNTDAYADSSVTFSKLSLLSSSGIEDGGADAIRVALATGSALTRTASGLSVILYDGGAPTLEVDTGSGGLRVKAGSIDQSHLAGAITIGATNLALREPIITDSPGRLWIRYASPLGIISPTNALVVLPLGLQTSHYDASSVTAPKISYDVGLSTDGSDRLVIGAVSPEFTFSGQLLALGQVPATKLQLASPSALQDVAGDLTLAVESPFKQGAGALGLNDNAITLAHLDKLTVARVLGGPVATDLSGLRVFSGLSPTGAWFDGASPRAYGLHPAFISPGLVVNTRTRYNFDYFGAAGQGRGTLAPYWRTYYDYDGQPVPPSVVANSDGEGKLIPTANSIGMYQLAVGNTAVGENVADSTRLPVGLGSYKELILSGKVSGSPVLSRGWSPSTLSDDIISVKVGDGLNISAMGQVYVEELGPEFLSVNNSPNEQSPIGFTGTVFGSVGPSPGDQNFALLYDTGSFTVSPGLGLQHQIRTSEVFEGATIPSLVGGSYSFVLGGGSPIATTVVTDSVEIYVNGLRLESRHWTLSPFDQTKILEIYRTSAVSPSENLEYALTQSPDPAYHDQVEFYYRLRKN
jgi:hypothetical protein